MTAINNPTNSTVNDPSVVDYLNKNGQKSDIASRGTLYTSTFGTTGSPYTGSAAQNTALLHALQTGYKSTIDNKSISGSASVTQNQNTNAAMKSGSQSISPAPVANSNTNTTPPPPVTSTTPPATNPVIADYQSTTQTAIDQAHQDAQVAMQPITDTFNANMQMLQKQKTDAIAAAKASYARANPYGSGSDQDEFIASITQGYDTQIQNASNAYADAVSANSQQLQDNVNNINATYQQNVQTYRQNQTQNLQWTLANDFPEPLNLKGLTPETLQGALSTWAGNNQQLIDLAFSTGQYGDENNMPDYWSAVAQLASPSKGYIEEQAAETNAAANTSRARSAAVSAGAAAQNAATNAGNAASTTQTAGPNLFQGLWNDLNGKQNVKTTTKIPGGSIGSADDNDPLGLGL